MTHTNDELRQTAAFIGSRISLRPTIGLILGSGLGDFADTIPDHEVLTSTKIPFYPASTVEGHKGALVFGRIGHNAVMAFQGRVHFYESGSADTACYPIEVAQALGIQLLIVTNAAGGINRDFSPGDLMIITDQINFTGETTRKAGAPDRRGRLFYDPTLVESTYAVGRSLGLALRRGIYAGVRGPSYETAAEVEMLHRLGADAVGMSTVLEVERASALGMRVLGLSCITNKAAGIGLKKLTHDDVRLVANKVRKDFAGLLSTIVAHL